ncbi:MAG: hypothetical protein DWQ31_02605 [Planctomycetota bacterium]|nr:MAG: hypothetical protein DWQ31_02605 [Planctomycetota bacterium]
MQRLPIVGVLILVSLVVLATQSFHSHAEDQSPSGEGVRWEYKIVDLSPLAWRLLLNKSGESGDADEREAEDLFDDADEEAERNRADAEAELSIAEQIERSSARFQSFVDVLNAAGDDGWELVVVPDGGQAILKRPKATP